MTRFSANKKHFRWISVTALLLVLILSVFAIPANVLAMAKDINFSGGAAKEYETIADSVSENDSLDYDKTEIIAEDTSKRTETSKTFVQADGTLVMQDYGVAVHYLEDGQFVNIDNTINDRLENTANPFKVSFGGNSENLVSISGESGKISMTPVFENTKKTGDIYVFDGNANLTNTKTDNPNKGPGNNSGKSGKGQTKPKYNNLAANINSLTIKNGNLNKQLKTALAKNNSSVYYSNLYNNLDIEYILEGKSLKENIIVHAPRDEYVFRFELALENLYASKSKSGEILITNENDEIKYIIPHGIMYDSNGEYSYEVEYDLEYGANGIWYLTVIADKEFFSTAAFPVTIDPTVAIFNASSMVTGSYRTIGTYGDKYDLNYFRTYNILVSVYDAFIDICKGTSVPTSNYYQIKEMIENKTVVDAKLEMKYDVSSATLVAGLKRTKDYNQINEAAYTALTYSSSYPNLTVNIMPYLSDELFNNSVVYIRDTGKRIVNFSNPVLTITYVEQDNGYNITQDLGEGGKGVVSLYTGKLNYIYDDVVINDGFMPITISHIYSEVLGATYGVGYNFKLNIQQKVGIEGDFYYYIDSFGKKNYFANYSNPINKPLGLTLYKNNSTGMVRLIDRQGNSLVFNAGGDLWQVHQYPSTYETPKTALMMQINYSAGKITSVTNNKTTLTFIYSNNILSKISNGSSVLADYTYTSDILIEAKKYFTENPYKTAFYYNNNLKLQHISNGNKENIEYYYSSDNKIEKILTWVSELSGSTNTILLEYIYDTKTVIFGYQVPSGNPVYGMQSFYTGAVLTLNNKYTRQVIFDENEVIADYSYEQKENGVIPAYAYSNDFDYFSFDDTYAETRDVYYDSFDSNTFSGNASLWGAQYVIDEKNTKSLYVSGTAAKTITKPSGLSTSGKYNYAVSLWMKGSGTVKATANGTSATHEFSSNITDWQFYTLILENIENLNSVKIDITSSNGAYIDGLRITKLSRYYQALDAEITSTADGILVVSYRYNAADHTISIFESTYNTETGANKEYPGRLARVAEYTVDADTPKDQFKNQRKRKGIVNYFYNSNNQLTGIIVTDSSSNKLITSYSYNNAGQLESYADANGVKTSYTYNADGSVKTTVAGGTGSPDISTTNIYKQGTGLLTSTQTGSIITSFGYTKSGALSVITHNGFNTTFDYNDDGTLKKIEVPGRTLVQYSYTESVDSVTYGNGQSVRYEYDADNVLKSIKVGGGTSIADFYYYDGQTDIYHENIDLYYEFYDTYHGSRYIAYNGPSYLNAAYVCTEDGSLQVYYNFDGVSKDSYSYIFSPQGLLTNINKPSGSVSYSYDDLRLTSKSTAYGSGYTASYSYISGGSITTNLVSSQTLKYGTTQKSSYTYEYYSNGNLKSVTDAVGRKIEYQYDQYNRLVNELDYAADRQTKYEYDSGGNIKTRKTYTITEYSSQMDSLQKAIERPGIIKPPVEAPKLLSTDTYTYGDVWKDLLTSYNGQQITYDGAGNPTSYKGSALAWKNGRQLTSYGSNTYVYDYAGIRTQKNNTFYYVEDNRILAEKTGSNLTWYYYDESGVCGMRYGSADYYFEKNILGDIISIYSTSGALVGTYTYDAWGRITSQTDNAVTNANPFRYRGYYYDSETKLYYLNSRYYDPETGRFINADEPTLLPLLSKMHIDGANLYSYCFNNPIKYRDDAGYIPVANHINKTHVAVSLINNAFIGTSIGNISFTTTKQDKNPNIFYSYSDYGNDGNQFGFGYNLFDWIGTEWFFSTPFDFGVGFQITPWLHVSGTIGASGIGFTIGIDIGDTSYDISIQVGLGTIVIVAIVAAVAPVLAPIAGFLAWLLGI